MENYIINKNTLLILPFTGNRSKIIENYCSFIINKSPIEVIDESCKFYGSSFKGRCDSTNYLIGVKYKCPIIISETKHIILFPTLSYKQEKCIWINPISLKNHYSIDQKSVKIILINNTSFIINISSRIITNQIFKSSRLDSVLRSKK